MQTFCLSLPLWPEPRTGRGGSQRIAAESLPAGSRSFFAFSLMLVGTLLIAVLLVTLEPRAYAYVDPGSGFSSFRLRVPCLPVSFFLHAPSLEADHCFDAKTSPNVSGDGYTERHRSEPPIRPPPSDE
jgi:hypothetical protein